MKPIKLVNLIDVLERNHENVLAFLNLTTGEFIELESRYFQIIEDVDQRYLDWEQEAIAKAAEIEENDENFLKLPESHEINNIHVVRTFCKDLPNELADIFFSALRGKGAYKRFRQLIDRYNLEKDWYTYKDQALIELAKEWCNENKVDYIE